MLEFRVVSKAAAQVMVDGLVSEHSRLSGIRDELNGKIEILAAQIDELKKLISRTDGQTGESIHTSQVQSAPAKRANGVNEAAILKFLREKPQSTVRGIHLGTGVGLSSVQAVLNRKKGTLFVRDDTTGAWSAIS